MCVCVCMFICLAWFFLMCVGVRARFFSKQASFVRFLHGVIDFCVDAK